jgi:uncharacterized protein DUF1569
MKTLRNASDKAEILRRLESVQPASQRCWGSMSAHNMICHLSDGFRLYMGDRPAKPAPVPALRLLMKWVALWAPIPWPHGFKTMPEIDQQGGGTRPVEFASDMQELRNLIERFTQPPVRFCVEGHPDFGRLSEKEWMRLAYLHADHHLHQFGA